MLKKPASFVLASLRGSTYSPEYASPLHSLRPRWTAFLNILWAFLVLPMRADKPVSRVLKWRFDTLLVLLLREMLERDVEKRHIRVLQLKAFFPDGKGTVTDGEQLLLIEVELALVVDGPFKLARHS